MTDNITIEVNGRKAYLNKASLPQIFFRVFEKIEENKFNTSSDFFGNIKKCSGKEILEIKKEFAIIEKKGFFSKNEFKGTYVIRFNLSTSNGPVRDISTINIPENAKLDEIFKLNLEGFRYFGSEHQKFVEINKYIKETFRFNKNNWFENYHQF